MFLLLVQVTFIHFTLDVEAQFYKELHEKVVKAVGDYQDYSSLGRLGNVYVDEATTTSFKNLFEPDANLFWDLYKPGSSRNIFLLTVDEYVDSILKVYRGRKPVIDYSNCHIELKANGKTAIVYLHKNNYLPGKHDSGTYRLKKTGINLRILFNVRNNSVYIQNITEDARFTRIRGFYLEGSFMLISQVTGPLFSNTVSSTVPIKTSDYSFSCQTTNRFGVNIDLRLTRKKWAGFLITTGILYSAITMDVKIRGYTNYERKILDPSTHPFELSIFDRSNEISENIRLYGFSIPVMAKWYLTHSFYLKAGSMFSMLKSVSRVHYFLSHTGGGRCVLLDRNSLPGNERVWFYIDENHELNTNQYGFFSKREFSFSTSLNINKIQLSAEFSVGIEKRIKPFLIAVEPWVSLGLTDLVMNSRDMKYKLYPETEYHCFLGTCSSIRLNAAGIKLLIGKIFNR